MKWKGSFPSSWLSATILARERTWSLGSHHFYATAGREQWRLLGDRLEHPQLLSLTRLYCQLFRFWELTCFLSRNTWNTVWSVKEVLNGLQGFCSFSIQGSRTCPETPTAQRIKGYTYPLLHPHLLPSHDRPTVDQASWAHGAGQDQEVAVNHQEYWSWATILLDPKPIKVCLR